MMEQSNRLRRTRTRSVVAIGLALALGVVAVVSIPGCRRSSGSLLDGVTRGEPSVDIQVVGFPDPGLAAAIRDAVGKATGDIFNTDLTGMKHLDASSRGISNLEGIQHCADLEWIELGDNEIIDISALSSLINLKAFGLQDNQIVDISALSVLPNVWLLELSNNQIVDITPLVDNAGIGIGDIVVIQENQLLRQSGSQDMLGIEALQRRGVNVLFTAGVAISFPDPGLDAAIREAIGKPAGDIYDIYLFGLPFLDANDRGIVNLEGIRHCVDLEKLLLHGSRIVDFSPLLRLANLRWLDLSNNEIADVSVLSRLTNLTELWLPNNEIVDISRLADLTNLRTLYLSHNKIVEISALSGLTDLWLLGLGDNQIVGIGAVSGLADLEMLTLGDNQIVDISALSGLINLKHLYLSNNAVVDISALSGLTNLKTLSLDLNQIVDIQALVDNSGITSMDWVDVRYNNLDLTRGSPDMRNIEALEDRGVDVDFYPET